MLEPYVLPCLQFLEEQSHIPHAYFDRGARLARLGQDREVKEIVSIFKVVVCILRTEQREEDFMVASDLFELNAALQQPGHRIGKIFEARDAQKLSFRVDLF